MQLQELQQRRLSEQAAAAQKIEAENTGKASVKTAAEVPALESKPRVNREVTAAKEPPAKRKAAQIPSISTPETQISRVLPEPHEQIRPEAVAQAAVIIDKEVTKIDIAQDLYLEAAPEPVEFVELLANEETISIEDYSDEVSDERSDNPLPVVIEASNVDILEDAVLQEPDENGWQYENIEDITETYDVLIAIIKGRDERALDTATEVSLELAEVSDDSKPYEAEPTEQVSFEAYITSITSRDDAPNLESISDMAAEEQPLEDTLVQLADYLSKAPQAEA